MGFTLTPVADEAEYGDPALAGEWAAVLPVLLSLPQTPPWCSYGVRRDGTLVGSAGFKAHPDSDGRVEVAYMTFLPFEGQGVAKHALRCLLQIAAQNHVHLFCAHTLPEMNPSCGVLQASGFALTGAVDDPVDGPVWRWEKP